MRPLVEKAALAMSANEAWALLAGFALLGVLLIPLAGKFQPSYATSDASSKEETRLQESRASIC